MRSTLSPRDLAKAIGVSESSLKRWADEGQFNVARTAGGHRRITLPEAIRFVRTTRLPVLHPDLLGLPNLSTPVGMPDEQAYFHTLHTGDAPAARALLLGWYLDGRPVADLADGPIRHAMHRLGDLFGHAPDAVFVEHRATDICLQSLHHLRTFLPAPAPDAPVAVGAAPAHDPYLLPSLLASMTLAEAGFATINLGPDTPLDALEHAAVTAGARIVWLSCSVTDALAVITPALPAFAEMLHARQTALYLGGRAFPDPCTPPPHAHYVPSMAALSAHAQSLLAARS